MGKTSIYVAISLMITITICISAGCNSKSITVAAPLDDRATLEKLALAYQKQAESIPVSPTQLAPPQRKRFVEQVFNEAGFSYAMTLQDLARINPATIDQLHKDMKDLLFLPHYGVKFEEVKSIYSAQEQTAILTILKTFP